MREIKFRAWDEERKSMCNVTNINFYDEYMWVEETPMTGWRLPLETTPLMQYTGLIDKNGKCIFESDIIGREGVYHFISRSGWDAEQGSWWIIGEKLKNFTGKENDEEKYIAGYKLVVVEPSKKTGFEPFCDSEDNCYCCGGGDDPSEYEVLGNLYEHPTLLQQHI